MRKRRDEQIEIGLQIRTARRNAELTQEVLAERIDVTSQYLSDLERGLVGVSLSTLKRICTALDTTPNFLLGYDDSDDRLQRVEKKLDEITRLLQ